MFDEVRERPQGNKVSDYDMFGFGMRMPLKSMSDEAIKKYLRRLIENSNRVVYTAIVNNNSNKNANAYVAMFLSVGGEIVNISQMAGQITGIRVKRRLTDYVYMEKGQEVGKAAVKALQKALYAGMFLKEDLVQKWV